MADLKISQLTGATTPLAGTEVLPIVQSGSTKKVSVADLTAGRDASVKKLTATDNLVVGTAGKGLDFSANGGDVLTQYDVGTWTPSVGGNATYTIQEGYYARVGDLVYVQCQLIINVLGTGSTTTISGLPFTALNPANSSRGTGSVWYCANLATNVTSITPGVTPNGTTITFGGFTAAGASMSVPLTVFQNGTRFDFSMTYRAN